MVNNSLSTGVQAFLASPLLGYAATLILLAVANKMSTSSSWANAVLVLGWIIFVASASRTDPIATQAVIPRVLWTMLFSAVSGLMLYHFLWMSPSKSHETTELINWQRGDPNNPPYVGYLTSVRDGVLTIQFIMENPSEFPGYDISVRVWDIDNMPKDPTGEEEILSRSIVVNIPSLAPRTSHSLGSIDVPPSVSTKRFGAQFTSRIGAFVEIINVKKIDETWLFAIRVSIADATGKVVFRSVDPGFPMNKNGDVDW